MKKILLLFLALGAATSNAMVHPNQQLAPIQQITQQLKTLEQKPQATNVIAKTKMQKFVELLKANPILAMYLGALAAEYIIFSLDFLRLKMQQKDSIKEGACVFVVNHLSNLGVGELGAIMLCPFGFWQPIVVKNLLQCEKDMPWFTQNKDGSLSWKAYCGIGLQIFIYSLIQLFLITIIFFIASGLDLLSALIFYKNNPDVKNKNFLVAFYNWIRSRKQPLRTANNGKLEQVVAAATK